MRQPQGLQARNTHTRKGSLHRRTRLRHPENTQPSQRRQRIITAVDRPKDRLTHTAGEGIVGLFTPESAQRLRAQVRRVQISGK